jgi:hypothetical protein
MLDLPNGFEFEGLYVYPAREEPEKTYFVAPTTAAPEQRADGNPAAMLIRTGPTGFFQLGVVLRMTDRALEQLRQRLAARDKVPADSLRIAPAPMEVRDVVLSFGDGHGTYVEAARRPSSGFPPYTVMFSLPVDTTQASAAAAALGGREGFALIRYDASVSATVSVEGVVAGDFTRLLATVPTSPDAPDLAACAERHLREAVEDGRVSVSLHADPLAPAALRRRAETLAWQQAIDAIVRARRGQSNGPDGARATFRVALRENVDVPNGIETDVGSWFATNRDSPRETESGREL